MSVITTIALSMSENSTSFLAIFISEGFTVWKLFFLIIMVTTVPFLAIEPLKKRFTRKNLLPFQFLAGSGTGFLVMGIVGIILNIGT